MQPGLLRQRNDDVYIYKAVRGAGASFPRHGYRPFVWLSFSIPRMQTKSVRWEQSKRFLNESLLCLSPSNATAPFEDCVFATVAERDPQQLTNGKVGVRFVDPEQMKKFDWDLEYDMVESTCFFGAVSPVLSALKTKKNNGKLIIYLFIIFISQYQLSFSKKSLSVVCFWRGSWMDVRPHIS